MSGTLSVKDQLQAMISGTDEDYTDEEIENTAIQEDVEDFEDIEDTDQEDETTEEDETNDEDDDSDQDTLEADEESKEEDAQNVEEDSEESNNITEVEEGETEKDNPQSDEVDYKSFYEKVALAKFTANGKEVEGFKNPEDLVRAQQMLHGYSDKMKVFKEYKPFIKTLEERKLIQDPDKFNLAMSLLDGDVEAIKKVLKDKNLDPMELDLEDINYVNKNVLPSEAQLVIEEAYEQANNLGVGDKFNKVITNDWDVESLKTLVENRAVKADLLTHLKNGTYDIVQDEIRTMEMLDSDGSLDKATSIEKYRLAISRLNDRVNKQQTIQPVVEKNPKLIVDKKQEEEFKKKAVEKENKIAEERKKAASVTKTKTVKKKQAEVKPEALKGEEFRNYFKSMLMS